jgi:hypothetical protein
MPVGYLASRELADKGGPERREDVRLYNAPGIVNGFAPSPLIGFEIVGHGIRNSERALAAIMTFLSPKLGAPPVARGVLCLAVIEDGGAIGVLSVICHAQSDFAITAIVSEAAGYPGAAARQTPIAEVKADFQSPEVGLWSDRQTSPRRARFELGVTD